MEVLLCGEVDCSDGEPADKHYVELKVPDTSYGRWEVDKLSKTSEGGGEEGVAGSAQHHRADGLTSSLGHMSFGSRVEMCLPFKGPFHLCVL